MWLKLHSFICPVKKRQSRDPKEVANLGGRRWRRTSRSPGPGRPHSSLSKLFFTFWAFGMLLRVGVTLWGRGGGADDVRGGAEDGEAAQRHALVGPGEGHGGQQYQASQPRHWQWQIAFKVRFCEQ